VRRGILITVLAVLAFVVIVIARLPANWVVPASVPCGAVDGSIWDGTCTGLVVQGSPMGDLQWNAHAWRLLTGKLAANLTLTRPTGSISGDFQIGFDKSITAHDLKADLPLDKDLLAAFPPGMRTLTGTLHADLALLQLTKNNIVTDCKGLLEIHDLADHDRGDLTRFGNYQLTFPGGTTPPAGQLKDLGGPLGAEGSIVFLQDKPGFNLDIFMTLRPDASPTLVNNLQYLAPDAQGRRELQTEFGF